MTTVQVDGLNKLVRQMQALGVEVADLKGAFSEIARLAANAAAVLAPRKTGALAASVRGNRAKSKAVIRAGSKARVPYAAVVNYGWPARGIKASHFMDRASDQVAPLVPKLLDHELTRLIRAKGLA